MNNKGIKSLDVVLEAEGKSSGKMRNEVIVTLGRDGSTFDMVTDESSVHGGDDSAPPPLAYFATGLVTCLMTQIKNFAKHLNISIQKISVNGKCHWRATMDGRKPYVTRPVGFNLDIDISSDANLDDLKKLIEIAKKACFIEQTLGQSNNIVHRLRSGDDWINV